MWDWIWLDGDSSYDSTNASDVEDNGETHKSSADVHSDDDNAIA